MFTPIAGWLPDSDDTTIGILTDVQDMIPTFRGYAGAPSPISIGIAALAAECRGAAMVTILDGTTALFAGTQTKIYKAGSSTWTDVSRVSSDYTGSSTSSWVFTQMGNVTIAVNKVDTSQSYVNGTSTDFDNMAEMPKCLVVEAVGNFLLLGNYNNGTDYVDGWGCSSISDYTDWTADTSTQCTYGRLYDTPGPIVGLKRLADYAIYYKQRSMYLARYVGLPLVWEFSLISDTIGAVSQESIVKVGRTHYFLGDDDFYAYDTSQVTPIGLAIKEWFNADCNNAKRHLTTGLHDQANGIVYWFYAQGTSLTLNAWIAYNYRSNKWGKGNTSIEASIQYVTPGASYDDLDAKYLTYDGFPSTTYSELAVTGLSRIPSIFDTAHTLKTINGVSSTSSLTSNLIGSEDVFTLLSRVRPRYLIEPTSATMTNYYGNSPGTSMTEDQTVTYANNKFDAMRSARWHKVKVSHVGNVEITGASITVQQDGEA